VDSLPDASNGWLDAPSDPQPDYAVEIFATGDRNSWRFSWLGASRSEIAERFRGSPEARTRAAGVSALRRDGSGYVIAVQRLASEVRWTERTITCSIFRLGIGRKFWLPPPIRRSDAHRAFVAQFGRPLKELCAIFREPGRRTRAGRSVSKSSQIIRLILAGKIRPGHACEEGLLRFTRLEIIRTFARPWHPGEVSVAPCARCDRGATRLGDPTHPSARQAARGAHGVLWFGARRSRGSAVHYAQHRRHAGS